MAATIRIMRPIRIQRHRPDRQPAYFVPLFSFSSSRRSNIDLDEIRQRLANYRSQSPTPPPATGRNQPHSPPLPPREQISFQELYRQNVTGDESQPRAANPTTGKLSFATIWKNVEKVQKNKMDGIAGKRSGHLSLNNLKDSLRLRPGDQSPKEPLTSIFPKEDKGLNGRDNKETGIGGMFLKDYSHQELGERLRSLRPERKGKKDWFSLQELKDRLVKVREIDDREASQIGTIYSDLRKSLSKIQKSEQEKNKSGMIHKLDVFKLGEDTTYLQQPPKEHLIKRYFDPANMSSAEKMKIELQKVRDELKMSESDCGSARVQVGQLTTKIKHLSGALHKKDKHSRKGLQAMVQRRKKLLKYLRRTDWDSYCLVLSKFGLRDNPDYKN